jgi:hypothetical protein
MSVDNFIPTIWSGNFIAALRKNSVFTSPLVVNRNWEGEIQQGGDTVKINQIGDVTVADYTKNSSTLTFPTLEGASALLKVDQVKAFSFGIDDVDKAQAKGDLAALGMDQAAYKMKDAVDSYIAGLYAQAGVTSGLGTSATPLSITAKASASSNISVVELFSIIQEALDEANCPTDGRFIVIPPAIRQKLILASILDVRSTMQQQDAMTTGNFPQALGFNILVSNNVSNTSGAKFKILAGTNMAITYAEQINKVEAVRREAVFGDGIKGLMIYGAKIVQANALACATVSTAAEA